MTVLSASERKRIADLAEDLAKEAKASGLLPADELEDMSLDELDAYMRSKGVTIDWERLVADMRSVVGSDAVHIDRGQELSDASQEALEERASKAVVRTARAVANRTIADLRNSAFQEADDRPDDEKFMVWVTVGGTSSCPDCRDRHGQVFAADMWQGMEPGDGTTVCRDNCNCSLVPCGDPGAGNEGRSIR